MPSLRSLSLAALGIGLLTTGCSSASKPRDQVVVYCSVDDVFARPIAERFQEDTGVKVQLVPDTEEHAEAQLAKTG